MKPGRIALILSLIFLCIIIYLNKCRNAKEQAAKANAGKAGQVMLVSGVIVKPQTISDHIFSSGTLLANEEVEIRNEIAGRLLKINFKEGAHVNKGNLLVKIYDEDLQAQL